MDFNSLLCSLRSYWRVFLLVHLLFTLLGITLLTPLFGGILQGLVSLSGAAAVADQDIARLLLTHGADPGEAAAGTCDDLFDSADAPAVVAGARGDADCGARDRREGRDRDGGQHVAHGRNDRSA